MDQICVVGLIVHITLTIVLIQFPILRACKSNGNAKYIIGWIAAIMQGLSEIIPLVKLVKVPPQLELIIEFILVVANTLLFFSGRHGM